MTATDDPIEGDYEEAPDLLDDDVALESIRKKASSRRFAIRTWYPDVDRVDAETFWIIWRDGVNECLTMSAGMSPMIQKAAELIVLMGTARNAVPSDGALRIAAATLANGDTQPLLEGWVAVRTVDIEALRTALNDGQ